MTNAKQTTLETPSFTMRHATVAQLNAEANAIKKADPIKSKLIEAMVQHISQQPGFNPDKALSISGHFGLHFMPTKPDGIQQHA